MMARFARDRGRLCPRRKRRIKPRSTSMRTRVRAVHHLNDDPLSGTPCRMEPQSREGLQSVLSFMSRFWQQFTHGGNFKQNHSGCEWISATNHFCPKPILPIAQTKLAISGQNDCGLRQSGGVGEDSEPQRRFAGLQLARSKLQGKVARTAASLPEACCPHKLTPAPSGNGASVPLPLRMGAKVPTQFSDAAVRRMH